MTRARNIAGFSTITTTPSPVHVGPIGVLTATRIDGEFNVVDIATRDLTAQGIGVTNLQVSGITTGLNVSGIITAQNGINFNGTSTGLNASGIGTIATLNVSGNATISGNANIGGVLTYEDVTNVDSVGVVTARGLSIFGNTTGLNAGISTFTGDVSIADKIIHTGDTNTAIRFPAADTFTVETAGTERLRITSDGDIVTQAMTAVSFSNDGSNTQIYELTGDGTAGNYGVLNISGNQNTNNTSTGILKFINRENSNNSSGANAGSKQIASIAAYAVTSDSNAGDDSGGYMQFATKPEAAGVSEAMRIDSSGRLLIGTTTEGAADADNLTIADSGSAGITLRSGTSAAGGLYFSDATSGTAESDGAVIYNHSSQYLDFYTAESQRLRIASDGNLALKTTTQNAYLGLTADSTAINFTLGSTAGTNPRMYLFGTGNGQSTAGDILMATGNGGIVNIRSAETIKFEVNSDNTTAEALFINSDNKISMGSAPPPSPVAWLHVKGNTYQTLRLENYDGGANGPYIELYNNSASPADDDYTGIISFKNKNSAAEETTYTQIRSQSTDVTNGTEDGVLTFHARGAGTFKEVLRITSNGYSGQLQIGGFSNGGPWSDNGGSGNGAEELIDFGSGTANRGFGWGGANSNYANIWTEYSSGDLNLATGLRPTAASQGYVSSYGGSSIGRANLELTLTGHISFRTAASGTVANGSAVSALEERMRILSTGNVYMGDSVSGSGLDNSRGFIFETSGTQQIVTSSTGGKNVMEFGNPNGNVGRITTSGSSTTYYNSSDYRLKENATTISDGITRLKTLIPRRFSWKVDSTNTLVDGFFAHEVTAVPEAISGVKDEVHTEDNPTKGVSKGDPLYQMIDQSKLVPLLTAALQEAIAKIETLESEVAALKGS